MKFLKAFALLTLALVIIAGAWGVWYGSDEKLLPEAEAFYASSPAFATDDNMYVAWNGLFAPAGTENTYDYGLKLVNGDIKPDDQNALRFEDLGKEFDCWTLEKDKISAEIESNGCASTSDIQEVFDKNQEFITRYKHLYAYTNSAQKPLSNYTKGQDIIALHQFLSAYWQILAESGHGEQAVQEWIDDTIFLQKVLSHEHTLVEHAVFMVTYGINIQMLPALLEKAPAQIEGYKDQMEAVLKFDNASGAIWANVMRGERALFAATLPTLEIEPFYLKPNYFSNRLYEWSQSIIWLATQPPRDFSKNQKLVLDKFLFINAEPTLLTLIFDKHFFEKLLLYSVLKGTEIVLNTHTHNAKSRALILYIQAKSRNISPGDMPAFLKNADEALYDPFTGKPFLWDETKNSISLSLEKDGKKDRHHDLYYMQ